jgi:hypothetical protein
VKLRNPGIGVAKGEIFESLEPSFVAEKLARNYQRRVSSETQIHLSALSRFQLKNAGFVVKLNFYYLTYQLHVSPTFILAIIIPTPGM